MLGWNVKMWVISATIGLVTHIYFLLRLSGLYHCQDTAGKSRLNIKYRNGGIVWEFTWSNNHANKWNTGNDWTLSVIYLWSDFCLNGTLCLTLTRTSWNPSEMSANYRRHCAAEHVILKNNNVEGGIFENRDRSWVRLKFTFLTDFNYTLNA